jgi:hypothetical protein
LYIYFILIDFDIYLFQFWNFSFQLNEMIFWCRFSKWDHRKSNCHEIHQS